MDSKRITYFQGEPIAVRLGDEVRMLKECGSDLECRARTSLIKQRSKGLIKKNVFKNEKEISRHINSIEKAKVELTDDIRTLELKNWLDYLRKI